MLRNTSCHCLYHPKLMLTPWVSPMSSDSASTGLRDAAEDDVSKRERMLDALDTAIAEAQEKIESGRVYDVDNEKVRIKWIHGLAYTMNVRRQIVQDRDLEELNERVKQLEQQYEDGGVR